MPEIKVQANVDGAEITQSTAEPEELTQESAESETPETEPAVDWKAKHDSLEQTYKSFILHIIFN